MRHQVLQNIAVPNEIFPPPSVGRSEFQVNGPARDIHLLPRADIPCRTQSPVRLAPLAQRPFTSLLPHHISLLYYTADLQLYHYRYAKGDIVVSYFNLTKPQRIIPK